MSASCGKHLYLWVHFAGPPGCVLRQGLSLELTALPRLLGSDPGIQLSPVPEGCNDGCLLLRLAFMCAEDLPSSPHACAAGTLLTELFYQPQWMLSLVPSYRQGNRGASILSRLHKIPEVPSDRNPSRVGNSHQKGNGHSHVKVGRREDYWRVTKVAEG